MQRQSAEIQCIRALTPTQTKTRGSSAQEIPVETHYSASYTKLLASTTVNARDLGQWDDPANADLKRWYQDLKQPDNPAASCCGEADAYWADAFEATSDGQYIAIITDPRDDEPLGRRHRNIGTRIVVPKNKIKWNEGNPVGHGIIFLNRADSVFCYLPPLGI